MTWPEIWEDKSFHAGLLRTVLTPISWLYTFGWLCYLAIYSWGLKKPTKPHKRIICIGNLVAGGSGKTPVTIYVARVLGEQGHQVVISASGYGGPHSEAAELAPEGELDPKVWGDEPAMLREELPHVPLIVGRRRVLAAEICSRKFPEAVLLMDDGFQHLPLSKDIAILVEPEGSNKRCLPAGPYREPHSSLKRADLVLGFDSKFQVRHGPILPLGVTGGSILCAIGNPDGFVRSIREAGYEIKQVKILEDHDPLDAPNLFEGLTEPIVVTAKDAVKLRERKEHILVARRETTVEPAAEFTKWLEEKLK